MVIDNFLSYVEGIFNKGIFFSFINFLILGVLDSNSVPQNKYGYHRDCYVKYTHKQQLEKANKRKGQEENESSKSQMLNTIDKRPIRQSSGKH